MSDLFKKSAALDSYSAKDIEVLEGLEPVRKRPGMYIGGTDERALHHLAIEVIDNCMDEAVAGFASKITVSLDEEGFVIIGDNGRGIPVDPHPKYPDKSALEVIMTTLHSGGKFSNSAYKTAGGLHGVGISVVNALSEELIVEVIRENTLWSQTYSRGLPTSSLIKGERVVNKKGTSIKFRPDPEIFGANACFNAKTLYKIAKSKAYLFKGVQINWSCPPGLVEGSDTPAKDTIHFPNGLVDFLKDRIDGQEPITPDYFHGEAEFQGNQGKIEWAITWIPYCDDFFNSYCNTIPTPLGGTHESGFRQALLRSLRDYADMVNNKKVSQVTADDLMGDSIGVLSVFTHDPQFQGQTKDKLVSLSVTKLVDGVIKDRFDHWLSSNPSVANILLEHIIARAEYRLKRREQKEADRKTATQRLRLPGKLADCTSKKIDETEIFLVEGDSAGGSAKQARDRKTQAILPLRGKILNVSSATVDKLKANQQIGNLITALGCGTGKTCDLEKLRYGRVIIMTDADVDGAHIAALLMTFFFKEMRPLVEAGRLYLAQPPLYRLSDGKNYHYARDEADKDHILKTKFKTSKVEISRFKGLGEMQWQQLKETTMSHKVRTLLRVSLPAHDSPEANIITMDQLEVFVENLMGKKPETRFNFIQANAKFAENLDI